MAFCDERPFSGYVKTESALGPCNYSVDEVSSSEQLISDSIRVGGKQLKLLLRRLDLHPTHPLRKTLWPRLISAKYSITIPSDNEKPVEFGSTTEADSVSNLAGYELSDQLLLPVFLLNEAGQKRLRCIMHQVARNHPELVYAPQLWPLTALLLHYHSGPVVEACINCLLSQPNLLTQTKASWIAQSLALERLGLRGFATRGTRRVTKRKLDQMPNEVRSSLARWSIALWYLPFGYLVRLIDCFLIEGPKVFYRAGLLLWKIAARMEKSVVTSTPGQSNNPGFDLTYAARNVVISSSGFMRKLFTIRNFSRSAVRFALELVQQSQSMTFEDVLIHPCKRTGQATYASYLVDDRPTSTSSTVPPGHPSDCITVSELATLITSIRDNKLSQLSKPVLIFSTNRDGTSLRTLYSHAADAVNPASLLLVRSRSGRSVIGAFCSDRWQARNQPTYYGSGLSFLFRVRPGPLVVYPWVGPTSSTEKPAVPTDQFQFSSDHLIHIGGGLSTGAPGLGLDDQLMVGTSGPSATFGSPCLITDTTDMTECFGTGREQGCTFNIGLVELIGFHDL